MLAEGVSMARWAWIVASTLFFSIPLVVSFWAFLDAARRPGWAWALSGRRQVVWMAAIMFGVLTVVPGLVISTWYLARVRPAIAAVEDGDLGAALGRPDAPPQ